MAAFRWRMLSDPHLAPLPVPSLRELIGKRVTGYLHWTRTRHKIHRREVLDAGGRGPAAQGPATSPSPRSRQHRAGGGIAPARAWLQSVGAPGHVTVVPGNHDAYARATQGRFAEIWRDYLRGDGA